jgi:hypothetical protein
MRGEKNAKMIIPITITVAPAPINIFFMTRSLI